MAKLSPEAEIPRRTIAGSPLLLLSLFIVTLMAVLLWSRLSTVTVAGAVASASNPPAKIGGTEIGPGMAVHLPESHKVSASFGDIGPQLLAAGAIDYERFVETYNGAGRPLTPEQLAILTEGGEAPIVIDHQNAYFLLNFFWALGLVNQNPILTEGPMMQHSQGDIGRFASTGGWTIGQRPATELYASTPIIALTPEQQVRLEEVVYNAYRPCCDNHTAFADCNHGMAMLGLLQLLASRDATVDEIFAAAKHVNAFWFPQQALETAVFFKTAMNLDYNDVDPRLAVGSDVFSGSGFRRVHGWLAENGLLEQAPAGDGSCAVS